MFNGVGVICFAGSYLLAFALEIVRFFWKNRVLRFASLLLFLAGLIAHSAYLFHHFLLKDDRLVSSAGGWFFVLAWGLVILDLSLFLFYPKTQFSLFLLPFVFLAILAGVALAKTEFPADSAGQAVATIHGIALLLTTFLSLFGFITGAMFFLQRAKMRKRGGFLTKIPLPSLEWLQKTNRFAALGTLLFLGIGILNGFYLRFLTASLETNRIPVTDLMVVGALFLFLLLFALLWLDARKDQNESGGRIAFLSILCFLILAGILSFGILSPRAHWVWNPPTENSSTLDGKGGRP